MSAGMRTGGVLELPPILPAWARRLVLHLETIMLEAGWLSLEETQNIAEEGKVGCFLVSSKSRVGEIALRCDVIVGLSACEWNFDGSEVSSCPSILHMCQPMLDVTRDGRWTY